MTDCQETNYTYFSDTRETTASLRRQTPDATCFLSPSLLVTRSPCLPPAKRVFNEMCLQRSVHEICLNLRLSYRFQCIEQM